jgi:hypothetical protein
MPIRYGDVDADSKGVFVRTFDDAHSCLTLPLLASDLCLGTANLEHAQRNFYSDADQDYANALCDIPGEALLRHRTQALQESLLGLINDISRPREELFPDAFRLLYAFTGYGCLLYLVPDAKRDGPWRVERVVLPEEQPATEQKTAEWNDHIRRYWEKTYIKQSLAQPETPLACTGEAEKMVRDEPVSFPTRAQAVLMLYGGRRSQQPAAVLSLHFRMAKALNPFQRKLLPKFARFIGEFLLRGDDMRRAAEQAAVSRQQAQVGEAFAQFRHSLVNKMGAIGNALNRMSDSDADQKDVDVIRNILRSIEEQLAAARHLVKAPEIILTDLGELWNRTTEYLGDSAVERGVELARYDGGPLEYGKLTGRSRKAREEALSFRLGGSKYP